MTAFLAKDANLEQLEDRHRWEETMNEAKAPIMTAEKKGVLLAPKFKEIGFRKKALTWYRKDEIITILFQIQKSQFSSDVWYYNLGVGINCFYQHDISSISRCDITFRFDQQLNNSVLSDSNIFRIVELWISKYGTIEKLRRSALVGNLPVQTTKRAISFLSSVPHKEYIGDGS